MSRVVIIGAGASGLMAACAALTQGHEVLVLEKNEKAGKKIYITGKGRCNLTNACETADFFGHVVTNPRFLYSAVYGFDNMQVMQFFEENGCPLKTERGDRVFPVSDHASDVTDTLVRFIRKRGGKLRFHTEVSSLLTRDGRAAGVRCADGQEVPADAVIVCTGGRSYPSTGSTGDGYRFARETGHSVREARPSLVPLVTREDWCRQLQGLALKNVALTVRPAEVPLAAGADSARDCADGIGKDSANSSGKHSANSSGKGAGKGKRKKKGPVYEGFGEMLFTHFGVSGPLVLTASCYMDFEEHPEGFDLMLDLKPALTKEQLELRIRRETEAAPLRQLPGLLRRLFPARLSEVMVQLSGLDPARSARSLSEQEISALCSLTKSVVFRAVSARGFAEAIVTSGGVDPKEIDPSTMESKLLPGLYFAGEVIDVDAVTGGFNLQIAWSTGHLAGLCGGDGI